MHQMTPRSDSTILSSKSTILYKTYETVDLTDRASRLRDARRACGFPTATAAAKAFRWNPNTYAANENGNAPFSFRSAKTYADAYGVRVSWLYDGAPPRTHSEAAGVEAARTRLFGEVGFEPEGVVRLAGGEGREFVAAPPGGTAKALAIRVVGYSLKGVADPGGLIYFEYERSPVTPEMLGQVVVTHTDRSEVLVSRLFRGSHAESYDLESLAGPWRRDCTLRWAAHITAIIPPYQARRSSRPAPEDN
jgi:hypothetical protein